MEKQRKLTKQEEERLLYFEQLSADLLKEGYQKKDITAPALRANVLGTVYGLIAALPFVALFVLMHNKYLEVGDNYMRNYAITLIIIFAFIVVHELIHGLTFSMFTDNGFKDIAFGVIWKSLNPYCSCRQPLNRKQYLLALLMPCFVLGIIPCIISLFNHNAWVLFLGAIMISAAGGDLLISTMILKYKDKNESLYLDHPTNIGVVVFEK